MDDHPESGINCSGVQSTLGRPTIMEVHPVEEEGNPLGSVFTSPSGLVCAETHPRLQILSSRDETNLFFSSPYKNTVFPRLQLNCILIGTPTLLDVRGYAERL